MTAEKYQGHDSPLKERIQGIERDVGDIKNMMTSMYGRFGDLVDTTEATYKTVTYEPNGSHYTSDEDFDFLDEED